MKYVLLLAVVLAGLASAGRAAAGDCPCPPPADGWLHRLAPVGGCNPDGRGLFGWWPGRCCWPCCGTRDDYCPKPPPKVCWPAYPSFFTFGPPDAPSACAGCQGGPMPSTPR